MLQLSLQIRLYPQAGFAFGLNGGFVIIGIFGLLFEGGRLPLSTNGDATVT